MSAWAKKGIVSTHPRSFASQLTRKGRRVKMNAVRLRSQSLPEAGENTHMRAILRGELVGHAFATRWLYEGRQICLVTQLCVKPEFRRKGVATQLLSKLKEDERGVGFGILGSHPAAIMAALWGFGNGLENVDLGVVKKHAHELMATSPVDYVKNAILSGSLLGGDGDGEPEKRSDGSICCAITNFYVEHKEPIAVLEEVRKTEDWPLVSCLRDMSS
ncbi:hypothetical protein K458DRAFT_415517 [Lentithecium fluviatile CBS 122367]|uniref:N-acetyltransferase domain-containing protein n=1 Tax=Lentithecium fluviatile CBS 122367 TaxID=1168545 RepID=A0A6G1JAR5_9PLEO|nr:hypothetical protein K458DRAFT_415517 [Lentithecium fluviatile CBS 122367]